MITASEKFIEIFYDDFISKYENRKEAYDALCEHWREKYKFVEPITSYESFKQMLRYYSEKKKNNKIGIVDIKY